MSHSIEAWCPDHGHYDVDSDFPSGCEQCATERAATLAACVSRIELYGFECEAGALANCVDWLELKTLIGLTPEAPRD